MDFFEQSIKTYSGLSSETKPTIAALNEVPNGSRFREVDTRKTYFFNLSDDTWYESQGIGDFQIPSYDYLALTYVSSGNGAGEVETVTYKTGGSAGTTVATLTLTYNSSDEVALVEMS